MQARLSLPAPHQAPPCLSACPLLCSELPASIGGLSALEELSLQGNPRLSSLPAELGTLPALRDLSAADCALTSVPAELSQVRVPVSLPF